MDFRLRAHSVEIDKNTRDYAEAKIGKAVAKLLSKEGSHVDVEITNQDQGHGAPCSRVSVHVAIPHARPEVVTVEDPDLRAAIDLASDKINRAIKRRRQRRRDKGRSGGPAVAPPLPDLDVVDAEEVARSMANDSVTPA